jgi:hypothetical protein
MFLIFGSVQFKAGYTYQKFNRQFQYTVALLVYGLLNIVTPMIRGMPEFATAYALSGISSAYIDIATNVWVLELFADGNVNLFMQTVYFVFALGKLKVLEIKSSQLIRIHFTQKKVKSEVLSC